mmetsp:Transcript_10154/g.22473  ORF Transcript_10154/g.22473 Transcript_10154/m.22473 type:complete len:511 (-) Transcript_10154:28-1560(-)
MSALRGGQQKCMARTIFAPQRLGHAQTPLSVAETVADNDVQEASCGRGGRLGWRRGPVGRSPAGRGFAPPSESLDVDGAEEELREHGEECDQDVGGARNVAAVGGHLRVDAGVQHRHENLDECRQVGTCGIRLGGAEACASTGLQQVAAHCSRPQVTARKERQSGSELGRGLGSAEGQHSQGPRDVRQQGCLGATESLAHLLHQSGIHDLREAHGGREGSDLRLTIAQNALQVQEIDVVHVEGVAERLEANGGGEGRGGLVLEQVQESKRRASSDVKLLAILRLQGLGEGLPDPCESGDEHGGGELEGLFLTQLGADVGACGSTETGEHLSARHAGDQLLACAPQVDQDSVDRRHERENQGAADNFVNELHWQVVGHKADQGMEERVDQGGQQQERLPSELVAQSAKDGVHEQLQDGRGRGHGAHNLSGSGGITPLDVQDHGGSGGNDQHHGEHEEAIRPHERVLDLLLALDLSGHLRLGLGSHGVEEEGGGKPQEGLERTIEGFVARSS